MDDIDRRDFVKGLAAIFAVAAAPSIVSGVGAVMSNELTIVRWESIRIEYDFSKAFRLLGRFKYPPNLDPNTEKIYMVAKFDPELSGDALARVVKHMQREFEESVYRKYDTNCVFKYPLDFEWCSG